MSYNKDSLDGKTVIVSGFGNVAWGTVIKATELGAKVIGISGPDGYVIDKNGISTKERIIYVGIIAIATVIGFLILKRTDDPLPLLDAFTTTSSFVATYYMMTKKIDTWIIWFINDIFYAIEYFILPEQALSLFFLNMIWTVMAIFSYINWRKIMLGKDVE